METRSKNKKAKRTVKKPGNSKASKLATKSTRKKQTKKSGY